MKQDKLNIKTPEYVSLQFQLAGLGSRTAAFLIDQALLFVMNIIVVIVMLIILYGQPTWFFISEMNTVPIAITIILLFLINWGYFFAFEFFSGGRTIGKKLIGIRVIQENGHSLTLLSSFIRNLLRIIDSLPVNYFLGIIMLFFHPKHKRIGDLVAGTLVVHERKTNRNKKQSLIEQEIQQRGLSKHDLNLDEWTLKSLNAKDWKLLQTYVTRYMQLTEPEKLDLGNKIAAIIFPKIGLDLHGKNGNEMIDTLLIIYLLLKDEWSYEL